MAFSQFLLIWSGNLVEEIPWYLYRLTGGWSWVALAILVLHFALPFALLLSREFKRNARLVAGVAALVLFMRLVDMFWLVMPEFRAGGLALHWLDVGTTVAVGGVWLATYLWLLRRAPLLSLRDPRTEHLLHPEDEHGEHAGEETVPSAS